MKVLIASKHRFQALRDLTIDNALAELDRQALERKERGDTAVIRSPSRQSSFDSIRTPANARAPSLRNVPEHDQLDDHERFTIGDDEDEDGESESAVTSPISSTGPDVRLSERARGKQPLSLNETSRNASTTSLPTLTPISTSQTFRPSQQWLESWVSQSPLEEILHTIEEAEIRRQHVASTRNSTSEDGHLPGAPHEKRSLESGREARQPTEGNPTASAQATHGADGQGSLKPEGMCCTSYITSRMLSLTLQNRRYQASSRRTSQLPMDSSRNRVVQRVDMESHLPTRGRGISGPEWTIQRYRHTPVQATLGKRRGLAEQS